MYRGVHFPKLASCTCYFPISSKTCSNFWGRSAGGMAGWPAADRGRGAACCYNYTPHSGASSPLLGGGTAHIQPHSFSYSVSGGTRIAAFQAPSLNTFDRMDSITSDLWHTIGLDQPEPDPPCLEASSLCFTPYLLPLRRFIQGLRQVDIKP